MGSPASHSRRRAGPILALALAVIVYAVIFATIPAIIRLLNAIPNTDESFQRLYPRFVMVSLGASACLAGLVLTGWNSAYAAARRASRAAIATLVGALLALITPCFGQLLAEVSACVGGGFYALLFVRAAIDFARRRERDRLAAPLLISAAGFACCVAISLANGKAVALGWANAID